MLHTALIFRLTIPQCFAPEAFAENYVIVYDTYYVPFEKVTCHYDQALCSG